MTRLPIIDSNGGVLVCTCTKGEYDEARENEPVHFVRHGESTWLDD